MNELPTLDFLDSELQAASTTVEPIVHLEEGQIDPRLLTLSHSSRLLLHSCPRKYQLYKLRAKQTGEEDLSSSVTFAYGTTVGIGIQSTLENKSEDQIILDMFLGWDTDLLSANTKQKKSFWEAIFAVQQFWSIKAKGYLADYELVYYQDKPAVELSFSISMPNGFSYRGYVDAVLRHTTTDEVIVLELKTTSGTPNSTTYKNSGQAIGYSVILDKIFPELSSYEVVYLVYATKSRGYTELRFEKSLFQRALWLQELLIDCDQITLYDSYSVYPMHGESCLSFFRDCEYLGLCTLSTDKLVAPLTESALQELAEAETGYTFNISFKDLVESQLSKGEI